MRTNDDATVRARIRNIIDRLKDLRSRSRCTERKKVDATLAKLDPSFLPSHFVMRKESSSLQTDYSAYWKEKEVEFIAIRSQGQVSSRSPSYGGVKRTLEFYKDGTKTDWVIHEYQPLDEHGSKFGALSLQEDVVIRKVFQKHTGDSVPSHLKGLDAETAVQRQLNRGLLLSDNGILEMNLWAQLIRECSNLYGVDVDLRGGCGGCPIVPAAGKRKLLVWEHFTKIRINDPEEVYAACHRCDRLLSAHPNNGTSHLKRHSDKCYRQGNISTFASTTTDQEVMRVLRAELHRYKQEKMEGRVNSAEHNAGPVEMDDPWHFKSILRYAYATTSLKRETLHGRWEEIKKERTAIREQETHQVCWEEIANKDPNDQSPAPRYVGARKTLELKPKLPSDGGNCKGWTMLEYYLVDKHKPPHQKEMVFRKIFHYDKAKVSKDLKKMEMWLNDEAYSNGEQEEVHEGAQGGQSRPGKRMRTGAPDDRPDVWKHFTKIYTSDPDRVYAVCRLCDRGYKAHPKKHGTSHLRRHSDQCSMKHHEWEAEIWPFELIFKTMKELENAQEAENKEDDLGGCYRSVPKFG